MTTLFHSNFRPCPNSFRQELTHFSNETISKYLHMSDFSLVPLSVNRLSQHFAKNSNFQTKHFFKLSHIALMECSRAYKNTILN